MEASQAGPYCIQWHGRTAFPEEHPGDINAAEDMPKRSRAGRFLEERPADKASGRSWGRVPKARLDLH